MQVVADLHSHSKYARAVSSQMVPPVISQWCQRKGIDIVGTGDWTHPLWLKELEAQLIEASNGLYKLKSKNSNVKTTTQNLKVGEILFLLTAEVAAIYSQGGKQRRIHLLIFAPSFEAVHKINQELSHLRMNLFSDGRPILGMSARDILKITLDIDPRCLVIPAHAWTPWFSIFGSMSGFNSIEECFGDLSQYIYGIETGLSSDPGMNWRIDDLDKRSILSFSDAHSAPKLGREATVFELPEVSYEGIRQAIVGNGNGSKPSIVKPQTSDVTGIVTNKHKTFPYISYTLEFYPEEGKYHYTGHRGCQVSYSPKETEKYGVMCPKCKRPLTVGVMQRVQDLSAHKFQISNFKFQIDESGVRWIENPISQRPPYVMMVPLLEILAESLESTTSSQKVINEYKKLTETFENEFGVLLRTKPQDIERVSGQKIAEAVSRVRAGNIVVEPGYDGEFGKVRIWNIEGQKSNVKSKNLNRTQTTEEQMGLF